MNGDARAAGVTAATRRRVGWHAGAQVAMALVVLGLLNAAAFRHHARWDWSRDRSQGLSPVARDALARLDRPARVVVFLPRSVPFYDEAELLLKEAQAWSRGRLTVEWVNPLRDPARAREVAETYRLAPGDSGWVVVWGDRSRFVPSLDLVDLDPEAQRRGGPPVVRAFRGEEVLVNALAELAEGQPTTFHFMTGHGEMAPDDAALSTVREMAQREHVAWMPAPADAGSWTGAVRTLVLAGPRYDVSEAEAVGLERFWAGGGRMLVLLDPGVQLPRLFAVLRRVAGVEVRDDVVLRTQALDAAGRMMGIIKDATAEFVPGHETTRHLAGVTAVFPGGTRSLRLESLPAAELHLQRQGVVRAAAGFWAERDYRVAEGEPVRFDPGRDQGGQPWLAVAAEWRRPGRGGALEASSRAVIAGNAMFWRDDQVTEAHLMFVSATANWLSGRDQQFRIPAKRLDPLRPNLTREHMQQLWVVVVVVIPGMALLVTVATWYGRRS